MANTLMNNLLVNIKMHQNQFDWVQGQMLDTTFKATVGVVVVVGGIFLSVGPA